MSVRKSSVLWLALGILFVVGAVMIRFVLLPSMTKLPGDLDQSQKFEGTMQALDPQAFASNDLAHLVSPEMPITAERSLTVDAVDGDTAIVTSKAVLNLPGNAKQNDVHTYAVSRVDYTPVTLTADEQKTVVPAAEQATFEAHTGIAFSWPMNPSTSDAALYDSVTRTAQDATFVGEGDVAGRAVNMYKVDAAGPIESPAILAQFKDFPKQLPKQVIEALLAANVVPEASRAAVQAALPVMPDTMPVAFTSTNLVTAAVDKEFGAPIKVDQTQGMYVTVSSDGKSLPVLPLSVVKMHTADSDVASTADTLSKNSTILAVLGVWMPIILAILGIGLIAVAILRWRKPIQQELCLSRITAS